MVPGKRLQKSNHLFLGWPQGHSSALQSLKRSQMEGLCNRVKWRLGGGDSPHASYRKACTFLASSWHRVLSEPGWLPGGAQAPVRHGASYVPIKPIPTALVPSWT